jgi:hypothetical protein
MTTIYTTQTEFTHNTTPATVEQVWNDVSLTNEEVAAKLNTIWQVLKEVKRKNKKFAKVMTSERSKGLTGRIVTSDNSGESVVEETAEDNGSTKPNFITTEKITLTFTTKFRDEVVNLPIDIIPGSSMWKDVEQSLIAHGQHLSKDVTVYIKDTSIPATYSELLLGVCAEFEIKQNVGGGSI